ncbi:MAG: DUF2520 domain-containing protein [Pyrinomonadaceae bacterium]
MQTVAIVGMGRVGCALAQALDASGFRVAQIVFKDVADVNPLEGKLNDQPIVASFGSVASLDVDICFITTQDSKIGETAESLVGKIGSERPKFVFHTSGALESVELSAFARSGSFIGSVHPLRSIPNRDNRPDIFKDCYFGLEGSPQAIAKAEEIVKALHGKPFHIEPGGKALYHAAAVVACGHLTALIDVSRKMLLGSGLNEEMAATVLMPLIEGTVRNLYGRQAFEVLTGPFQRGDSETVERHLAVLKNEGRRDAEAVYKCLGEISIDLAEKRWISEDEAEELRKSLRR